MNTFAIGTVEHYVHSLSSNQIASFDLVGTIERMREQRCMLDREKDIIHMRCVYQIFVLFFFSRNRWHGANKRTIHVLLFSSVGELRRGECRIRSMLMCSCLYRKRLNRRIWRAACRPTTRAVALTCWQHCAWAARLPVRRQSRALALCATTRLPPSRVVTTTKSCLTIRATRSTTLRLRATIQPSLRTPLQNALFLSDFLK